MHDEMTRCVGGVERTHNCTECSHIDPKTAVTAQVGGGLDRNEYICYNGKMIQSEYLQICGTLTSPVASLVMGPVANPIRSPYHSVISLVVTSAAYEFSSISVFVYPFMYMASVFAMFLLLIW